MVEIVKVYRRPGDKYPDSPPFNRLGFTGEDKSYWLYKDSLDPRGWPTGIREELLSSIGWMIESHPPFNRGDGMW